jgi:DTW domain-containing protein
MFLLLKENINRPARRQRTFPSASYAWNECVLMQINACVIARENAPPNAVVEAMTAPPYMRPMDREIAAQSENGRGGRLAAPGAGDSMVPDTITPDTIVPIDTRIQVVILQHPQEQDRALGTAGLTVKHFRNAVLKVGLSWPSLAKILGRQVDPRRWAVLYLGSAKAVAVAPGREIVALNRKGEPDPDQEVLLRDIEGVVLLDGNWSQAKALWWRNAWMLKCRRVILRPARPSRYGQLRREPRRDGLSTIEAAAILVGRLENRPEIEAALMASFEKLLANYRAAHR